MGNPKGIRRRGRGKKNERKKENMPGVDYGRTPWANSQFKFPRVGRLESNFRREMTNVLLKVVFVGALVGILKS